MDHSFAESTPFVRGARGRSRKAEVAPDLKAGGDDDPPTLPPLHPDSDVCGNCASWCGFGSLAGGKCANAKSPRFKNTIARSSAACAQFARASQPSLLLDR